MVAFIWILILFCTNCNGWSWRFWFPGFLTSIIVHSVVHLILHCFRRLSLQLCKFCSINIRLRSRNCIMTLNYLRAFGIIPRHSRQHHSLHILWIYFDLNIYVIIVVLFYFTNLFLLLILLFLLIFIWINIFI